ncbi:MAG: hypothetical protein O6943_03830 [Bacteroidetes bacterium]|nr:hypothetical protein [Bacteroidota bacterium]
MRKTIELLVRPRFALWSLEESVLKKTVISVVVLSVVLTVASQNAAAQAHVKRAAYPLGEGPVVVLDLGHNNVDDPEFPPILAEWLTQDGYVVRQLSTRFDEATLASVDLVISRNPLSAYNRDNWTLPTPSAFSRGEIALLYNWILSGGALLLVVDHMPIPGAAEELLSTFNFEISNGFALDERSLRGYDDEVIHAAGRISFRRSDGSLADHPVTNGRTIAERVDSIVTAVGSAFRLPPNGQSLLTFGPSFISLLPESSWEFDDTTPRQAIEGWSQAGLARVGLGRVAILGDSMLLRSALEDTESWALQNPQFTLNVVHWLSGLLDGR